MLIHGQVAGTITEHAGRALFRYDTEYLNSKTPTPLSVGVPLESAATNVEPWLDGLLADNDNVRARWATDYLIRSMRPTVLLGTPVGRDCAGAVQFCRPEHTDAFVNRGGDTHSLTESDIAEMIVELRRDTAGWNRNRSTTAFTLAGYQTKTALRFDGAQWSLPAGSACTTHILKPAAARFPDLDIVEHLCQQAARNLGLQAATTECVYFGDERALVVQRYDREQLPTGDWGRVHQEDMCQALGVPPHLKYQNNGGPTPHDVTSLIREHSSTPDQDVRRFVDALIYNWLIVNTDAHAKNYGLLLDGDDVGFAPLYDLCSFIPYKIVDGEHLHLPKLKMAMKTGKDYTLRKTDRASAWVRVANQLNVSPVTVADRISVLADGLEPAFTEAIDTLPDRARASSVVADMNKTIAVRRATGLDIARRLKRSYPTSAKSDTSMAQTPEIPGKCGVSNKTKPGLRQHPHPGHGGRCAAGHQH